MVPITPEEAHSRAIDLIRIESQQLGIDFTTDERAILSETPAKPLVEEWIEQFEIDDEAYEPSPGKWPGF